MTSLLAIRDTVALNGTVDAGFLSHQLALPLPLVQAMLDKLTDLGKLERIEQESRGCQSGDCKGCPTDTSCRTRVLYRHLNGN